MAEQKRPCTSCPKFIYPGEVKLWTTVYLRYKYKPYSHKFKNDFSQDVKRYKEATIRYIEKCEIKDEHGNPVYFRVAFAEEPVLFPDDPYLKLKIYIEYADRNRFRHFASPEMNGDEVVYAQQQVAPENAALAKNMAGGIQGQGAVTAFNFEANGTGPVTPPKCPPDRPTMGVAEVASYECGFEQLS